VVRRPNRFHGAMQAAFACDSLADVAKLHLKKNKVVNKGVPGSTAAVWAADTNAMLAQIASGGVPEFIWLSIGGNDILDGWSGGVCTGNASTPSALACYDKIRNDTQTMLDALFKLDPMLQVVHFG
jgi:lysophospholipase L1-like esterase